MSKLKPMQKAYCLMYEHYPQEIFSTYKLAKQKIEAYCKNGTEATNNRWYCSPVLIDCDYKLVKRAKRKVKK